MKRLDSLKSLPLEHTEIGAIEYVQTGIFEDGRGGICTGLPPFCRVLLISRPGSGSQIVTEVWLPDDWNGVFVGIGNGGMAGTIVHYALADHIRKGYAAANTDMGTSRGQASGIHNPDVWKDFGWRATHRMTQLGKALLRRYYGKPEAYSYFVGDSTGGQQALSEAQRFPEDYDGIVAGVPANNRVCLHTYFLWNHVHLTDPDGKGRFTETEIQAITACAVKYFQQHGDGEPGDDFVSFPYRDRDTVADFLSFLRAEQPLFTDEQLSALRAVYTGPQNPVTGEQIYNGMPIGSEIYHCGIRDCQGAESPYFYPFIWAFGEGYNGRGFDFAADLDRLCSSLSADLDANDAELTPFYARGGKLLVYSGSADPCVPFPDAMAYYNRVAQAMGGHEKTRTFFRYFLFPGRDHGDSGKGTNTLWGSEENKEDLLTVLRRWREEGKAPDRMVAARVEREGDAGTVAFVRSIAPYEGETPFPAVCDDRYLAPQAAP